MIYKLENKIVLITGGLSGIGKACAIAAGNEGAHVAILDLETPNMVSVMNEIRVASKNAIFIGCNVSEFESTKKAIHKVVENFGRIDVALNNAGIAGVPAKLHEITLSDWNKVIGTNLNGVFNAMVFELAQMVSQGGGVIINMASILGKVGFATAAHYVAAKHGVLGITKTAALEYAGNHIRVNAICPGFINTPLLHKAGIFGQHKILQGIMDLHPLKRLGKVEEIAKGFVFLASGDSTFMTGTSMEIDGGYLAQ